MCFTVVFDPLSLVSLQINRNAKRNGGKKRRYHGCKGRRGLKDDTTSFVYSGPCSSSNNHGPEQNSHKHWKLVVEMFRGFG